MAAKATVGVRGGRGRRLGWGPGLAALAVLGALVAGGSAAWVTHRRGTDLLAPARAAYGRGDWQGAWDAARDRLRAAPGDLDALQILARSSARLGRDDSAQAIYKEKLLPAGRMTGDDYYLLGAGLFRQKQVAAARSVLEQGAAVDPNHADVLQELARLHAHDERLGRATAYAERLSKVPGAEARGDLLVGLLAIEQADPSTAADRLDRALTRDPSLRGAPASPDQARKLLARARIQLGKAAEAKAPLAAVLASGTDPEASWLLSRALLLTDDLGGASAAWEASGGYGEESAFAREPAPYVGSARCAPCHAGVHQSQQNSLHARTLFAGRDLDRVDLPKGPVADPVTKGVVHDFRREGGKLRLETRVDDETYRAVIEYALGSGDRGLTFVGRDEAGQAREVRISSYESGKLWDRTVGQHAWPPDHAGYLGMAMSPDDVDICLHCHATIGKAVRDDVGPTVADRGIGCERCHGPGGAHVKAVESKFPDLAIARPQTFSADRLVKLCAQCHSPRGNAAIDPDDKTNVRFHALELVRSRCYTESDGAFSCVTCHDPHHDADTSPAHYEAKCLACHGGGGGKAEVAAAKARTACPVNPSGDCLKCHMPAVSDAFPYISFTDHFIRARPRTAPPAE